ncbi:MAG: hypothetical protein MK212_22255 [Saprospiraceae bacterium]|nr:hypothetical protein [Saprospiraceae bacterium]
MDKKKLARLSDAQLQAIVDSKENSYPADVIEMAEILLTERATYQSLLSESTPNSIRKTKKKRTTLSPLVFLRNIALFLLGGLFLILLCTLIFGVDTVVGVVLKGIFYYFKFLFTLGG